MTSLDVEFEWRVDDAGYQLDKRKRGDVRDGQPIIHPGEFIIQRGGKLRTKKPLEIRPQLFLDFAMLDGSAESCLGFASKWGYLGVGFVHNEYEWTHRDDQQPFGGEHLKQWQELIRLMRTEVEVWKDNPDALFVGGRDEFQITDLSVFLVLSPPDGSPALRIQPTTLLDAMRLQFGRTIVKGAGLRTCDFCTKLFVVGVEGRRIDSKFCEKKCRADWHNAKKRRLK